MSRIRLMMSTPKNLFFFRLWSAGKIFGQHSFRDIFEEMGVQKSA
jgi:hypothetical protein